MKMSKAASLTFKTDFLDVGEHLSFSQCEAQSPCSSESDQEESNLLPSTDLRHDRISNRAVIIHECMYCLVSKPESPASTSSAVKDSH